MCFAMGAYHDLRRSRTACPLGGQACLFLALPLEEYRDCLFGTQRLNCEALHNAACRPALH